MKSAYNKPETKVVVLKTVSMIAVSGGIGADATLGRGFNKDDVSYGRQDNSWDIWGDGDYSDED